MARRTPQHLRKRPVQLSGEQRDYLATTLVDTHDVWIGRGYRLSSVGFWLNERGAYTFRAVYRAKSRTLIFVTKGAA